ncbi:MAG: hypothetical protein ACYTGS_12790, partial [Planctomycetota bacterium]
VLRPKMALPAPITTILVGSIGHSSPVVRMGLLGLHTCYCRNWGNQSAWSASSSSIAFSAASTELINGWAKDGVGPSSELARRRICR